jgi:hypothetical protein
MQRKTKCVFMPRYQSEIQNCDAELLINPLKCDRVQIFVNGGNKLKLHS